MSPEQSRLAATGFADGRRYERARPGYPREAIEELCARLDVGPGRRVLDLAAGTGKLTRELAARGAEVTAVEPSAGMRAALAGLPGVRVADGRAERIPLPGGSVEAVTVAQAFHWFDGPVALGEIHRVLVPAGRLGLVWNVMDRSVEWVDRIQERIHRHRGAGPWYAGHGWRAAFAGAPFGQLAHRAFANRQHLDLEGLRERVASISFVAALDPGAREAVLGEVADIVVREGALDASGRLSIPYVTDVFTCERR